MWFLFHFLHLSKKMLPAIVTILHMEEKQAMYRLKSLKEKTLVVLECFRWKGLENLCEIFESYTMYYKLQSCIVRWMRQLTHWRNGSIVMRKYSLTGCLSFTTLNVFENKTCIIKILVYRSVIDINQLDVIFFAIIITGEQERFA